MSTRHWRRLTPIALLTLATLGGCANAPVLRGRVEATQKLASQAELNGAVRCAPRELAMAQAHAKFAATELDQGFPSRAEPHLAIAEENAQAALDLSPPERCRERGFSLAGDRDGDGFLDPQDQCPDIPETWNGFQDEDGCPDDPDSDLDGIPDSRDLCVLEAEDKDEWEDQDGCPEVDDDLDGVLDSADKCRHEPEDPDGFQDDDGCPDLDNDQDKIRDLDDACPNEAGPADADPTKNGCPGKQLVVVTDKEIRITQQIHFEFDRDVIRPESFPILDAVADVLAKNPKMTLEVQGHTDNKGQPAYNLRLSDRRAASVRKYLVKKGIDGKRLVSKGYGMTLPLVPNDSDSNRALNRRVQFIRTEKP